MKSEIVGNQEVQKEREYPWLGIADDGDIVLFHKELEGVVVRCGSDSIYALGFYGEDWIMSHFQEFKGQVILSND